jgi:TetR/AcrR family transcriptional repressor of nem operon
MEDMSNSALTSSPRRRGPGSRADANHPTRRELLDAAVEVLRGTDLLDEVSVARVTRHAGVAKGTFYVHFSDHDAFVLELHSRFHDRVFRQVATEASGLAPGSVRLRARLEAFLDACRAAAGTRSLFLEAHRTPALSQANDERWGEASAALAEDLSYGGCQAFVHERARLIVACVTEVARCELRSGRRETAMRDALMMLTNSTADRTPDG